MNDKLKPGEFETKIKAPDRLIPYNAELEHQIAILKGGLMDRQQTFTSRLCRTMRDITP